MDKSPDNPFDGYESDGFMKNSHVSEYTSGSIQTSAALKGQWSSAISDSGRLRSLVGQSGHTCCTLMQLRSDRSSTAICIVDQYVEKIKRGALWFSQFFGDVLRMEICYSIPAMFRISVSLSID